MQPTLSNLSPTSVLPTWLRYYCRLGYEVALSCQGPDDPSPFCQRLTARRQALREASWQYLQRHYRLNEGQAQHLFTQWSRDLFGQLLAQDTMRSLNLETALTESLLQ